MIFKLVTAKNKVLIEGTKAEIQAWLVKNPTKKSKIVTLSDYLQSIEKSGGYVDKRKDHYRVKTKPFTPGEISFLNSINGVIEARNMALDRPGILGGFRTYGIIRTKKKTRETKIVKKKAK